MHANIAHIAFNLLALAYLGVYAERAHWSSAVSIGISRIRIVADLFHGAIAFYIIT